MLIYALSPASLWYNIYTALELAGASSTTILWTENEGFFTLVRSNVHVVIEDVDIEQYP